MSEDNRSDWDEIDWIAQILAREETPEGLKVRASQPPGRRVLEEVGHLDFVVYRRSEGLETLIERVQELQRICLGQGEARVVRIDEAPQWKRNLKMAKRRLRRLVEEQTQGGAAILTLEDRYHNTLREVMSEAPQREHEFKVLEFLGDADLDLRGYWSRKLERVLLLVTAIPFEIRHLLDEAHEAYCHGLFRATAALCRAVLETLLWRIRDDHPEWHIIPQKDNLHQLIASMPPALMTDKARKVAYEVKDEGNRALHDADSGFDEIEAWTVLERTSRLVEFLVNRV